MRSGEFEISTSGDLEAVEADWERIEAEGLSTPFQTRAWLRPFYRILAPALKAKPLFVVVRDAKTGRPAMFLPLCVLRRLGVATVEFADLGVSDYNAPILSRSFDPSPAVWARLWRDIVSQLGAVGSVLRLTKLPSSIEGRSNPLLLGDGPRATPVGSWGVDLPANMEDFNKHMLTTKLRRDLARQARRIAERGTVDFSAAAASGERRKIFEVLASQRQARCDVMGRRNILANPAYRRFYDAVIADDCSSRLTDVSAFKVGDQIIGAMLALRHRDAAYVIMFTFEGQGAQWKSFSLGNIVIHKTIERSIGEGVRYFDLTIGDEAYKQDFGAARRPLFSDMRALTPCGAVLGSAMHWGVEAKRMLEPARRRLTRLQPQMRSSWLLGSK